MLRIACCSVYARKVFARAGEFTCIARMCALPVVAGEATGCFCLVTNLELASGERAYARTLTDRSLQARGDGEEGRGNAHCSASGPQVTGCCVDVSATAISHADYNGSSMVHFNAEHPHRVRL